jgi:glycosyltransferase involved in cell wall biosynthesis
MTRILVWSEYLWPISGGAELATWLLSRSLQACGHDVEVVTSRMYNAPEDEVVDGLQIRRVLLPPTATADQVETVAAGLARTRRIIARFQPELMLLSEPLALLMYYVGTRKDFPVTTMFSIHAHLEDEWTPTRLTGRIVRASDYVTSCSAVLLESARKAMPEIAAKSQAIVNALPLPGLTPAPLPLDAPRFLCIGKMIESKNYATAIRAFARIAAAYPAARLVMTGDGAQRALLHTLVDSLGIADRVDFTGWIPQDEVYAAMNRVTAILVPSLSEGMGLVALQGMQMGRPVIASAVDGLLELVVDGETGYLAPPGDDAALAERMARLLDNPEATLAMGQAARRRATADFVYEPYVEKYDRLVRRLVEARSFRAGYA